MSQENVESVRRLIAVYNELGIAGATAEFFASDAIFEEPPNQPGTEVADGRDEVATTFSRFDAAWEEHRSEPEEIRAIDDERVLMLSIEHLRGREGVEFAQPGATIFTFRKGKVVRMQSFWDRDDALEAAGLRE
jgi:ketosteroid isomerase-like protein